MGRLERHMDTWITILGVTLVNALYSEKLQYQSMQFEWSPQHLQDDSLILICFWLWGGGGCQNCGGVWVPIIIQSQVECGYPEENLLF